MVRVKKELTLKQKLFCELYATVRDFFGNGTQAYIEAYNIDVNKKGAYTGARASASGLLTSTNILEEIRRLLDTAKLNDEFVDKELSFVIEQNADMSTKMRGISEYNKLKTRITDKIDTTVVLDEKIISILDGIKNQSKGIGSPEVPQ